MVWTPPAVSLEEMVCERLALCAVDAGVNIAYPLPPTARIVREDLPVAYNWFGGTVSIAVPDGNMLCIPRTYTQRVLVCNINDGATDIGQDSEVFRRCLPWFTRLHSYYHEHPMLQTEALDELQYCLGILPYPGRAPGITDPGITSVPGPNGETFAAIDLTLVVKMSYPSRYGGGKR